MLKNNNLSIFVYFVPSVHFPLEKMSQFLHCWNWYEVNCTVNNKIQSNIIQCLQFKNISIYTVHTNQIHNVVIFSENNTPYKFHSSMICNRKPLFLSVSTKLIHRHEWSGLFEHSIINNPTCTHEYTGQMCEYMHSHLQWPTNF